VLLAPKTSLGPYEILALIGKGGMGEVYRARDTKLDREVAIKVLPQALAQDAERTAPLAGPLLARYQPARHFLKTMRSRAGQGTRPIRIFGLR
jgi:serine/threonine protein kinase